MSGTFLSHRLRPTLFTAEPIDFICNACSRRGAATYRRTRKALKVVGARKDGSTTESRDHIIFDPPSSAPNIYHTPFKFLPANDKRKALYARQMTTVASPESPTAASSPPPQSALAAIAASRHQAFMPPSFPPTSTAALPAPLKPIKEKQYHIGQAEVDEMRRLRREDTRKWTFQKLADKFGCSRVFVMLQCGSIRNPQEERKQQLELIKSKWGRRKTEAREDRKERKALWGMA
jgi:hypothetical protein